MAKTIIQTIGPLYGEVVNGTVFGRPNGSIFVPPNNTISIKSMSVNTIGSSSGNTRYFGIGTVNTWGTIQVVAQSQDLANYIVVEYSDTDTFETSVSKQYTAGLFNINGTAIAYDPDLSVGPIVDGTTYYVRAVLMSATNVPVATSDTYELTGVAE